MAGTDRSRGFSGSSAKMTFIVSSNAEKFDPATRKLIRSHAVRGRKRKTKHPDEQRQAISRTALANRSRIIPAKFDEIVLTYAHQLYGRVGSDLSFVKFADEVEPSVGRNLTKCQ